MAMIWTGTEVSIPLGWHLCDGTLGTRDLRNKFIVGSGDSYAVAATGGNLIHAHNVLDSGHDHGILGGAVIAGGAGYDSFTDSGEADINEEEVSSLPPYFALCFIEKL